MGRSVVLAWTYREPHPLKEGVPLFHLEAPQISTSKHLHWFRGLMPQSFVSSIITRVMHKMPSWKHSLITRSRPMTNTTIVSHNRTSNKPNCFTVRKWLASILWNLFHFFFCLVLCLLFFRKLFGPDTLLRPFLLLVTSIHCSVRLIWQNPPCQSPSLSLTVAMSYKCSAFSHLNLSVCCPHLCSWRSPLRFTWSKPRLEVKHCSVITNRSKW